MYTHQNHNARSRSMRNIHNAHEVTAKYLLSKFQQWAGQQLGRATPRAAKHDDEESAVEETVAASVELIMVRMDLLAYYK